MSKSPTPETLSPALPEQNQTGVVTRRQFLKLVGGSAAAAVVTATVGPVIANELEKLADSNPLVKKFTDIFTAHQVEAAAPPMGIEMTNGGIFFNETNGGASPDKGYIVDKKMRQAVESAGGFQNWGPAVSRKFVDEVGRTCQAFQRGIFQLTMDGNGNVVNTEWANVFDLLSDKGKDAWLQAFKNTPKSFNHGPDQGLLWPQVVERHNSLLDDYPKLKTEYMKDPLRVEKYGLVMAVDNDNETMTVVRCQRAVFQLWKVNMPWAQAGQITLGLAGDIAKEAGLIPQEYLALETYSGGITPEPEPTPEGAFLKEYGDLEKYGIKIYNHGIQVGVVPVNLQAIAGIKQRFAPDDKFEIHFHNILDDVPQTPDPKKYDHNIDWSAGGQYTNVGKGRQLKRQLPNGVWQWQISLPFIQDIMHQYGNQTLNERYVFTQQIRVGILDFMVKKDNPSLPSSKEFMDAKRENTDSIKIVFLESAAK